MPHPVSSVAAEAETWEAWRWSSGPLACVASTVLTAPSTHLLLCLCTPDSEGGHTGSCVLRVSLQPDIFLHIILGRVDSALITTSEEKSLHSTDVERGG